MLWVDFALVVFAGSFAVGLVVLSPTAKKIEAVGPETPEGQALIKRVFALLRVDLVFLFSIVFAMTVKPTLDDVGVVLVAAVAVAVLGVVSSPVHGCCAGEVGGVDRLVRVALGRGLDDVPRPG